jgi:hypothetical protein
MELVMREGIDAVNACGSKMAGHERIAALISNAQAHVLVSLANNGQNLEAMQKRNVRMPPNTSACH